MNPAMRVKHDVSADEPYNYLGRDVKEGEVFYRFDGHTYGCIRGDYGIALSEAPGEYPFFEFPLSAVEVSDG